MKSTILFLCLLGCLQNALCQGGGFNRLYSFSDQYGAFFSDLAVNADGDTLFVCGSTFTDASLPYLSLVVAAIDTFGNLLGQAYHHVPQYHMQPSSMNRLEGGGYATTGTMVYAGFLTKISDSLKVVSNNLYTLNNNVLYPHHLIELSDGGFLMGGNYNKGYAEYHFIKRISPTGQEVWSKEYGAPTDYDFMTSFIKLDDSTFVAGGGKSPIYEGQYEWARSRIYAIAPKMGLVKWDWMGPLNEEASVHGLHQTTDKGWIYLTQTYEPNPLPDPVETWVAHIKVVRRDSAFNLLWERILSPVSSYWNSAGDLEATPDGNWVATGWWKFDSIQPNGSSVSKACLYKISDQGDSLWCTCLNPEEAINGPVDPGGIVVLPSGSTVWACRYDKYVPSPAKTYGWLIKVDNDGCVDTLCDLSGVFAPPSAPFSNVLAYPNPATIEITLESRSPAEFRDGQVRIWSTDGALQSVHTWPSTAQKRMTVSVAHFPPGMYFWEIVVSDGSQASGRFLKN